MRAYVKPAIPLPKIRKSKLLTLGCVTMAGELAWSARTTRDVLANGGLGTLLGRATVAEFRLNWTLHFGPKWPLLQAVAWDLGRPGAVVALTGSIA